MNYNGTGCVELYIRQVKMKQVLQFFYGPSI